MLASAPSCHPVCMTIPTSPKPQRKKAPQSRATGKAGMRRVEQVLEDAGLVVQTVDTDNDIGRDAYVDIVEDGEITGGIIAIQVKSGPSHFHNGVWGIPGDPSDFTLWQESTVPMYGIVHDPKTNALRWTDLSAAARRHNRVPDGDPWSDHSVVSAKYGKKAVVAPDGNRLDIDVTAFLTSARSALRVHPGLPASALLSNDPESVKVGIGDTFAIGRRDPDAFVLLAALILRLPLLTQKFAVTVLAMATRHPDVFWHRENWVPSQIKSEVERRIYWTRDEVAGLLGMIDEDGIQRGSFGQHVYHVLELDTALDDHLERVVLDSLQATNTRFWAAAVLLYRKGEDAMSYLVAWEARDLVLFQDAAFRELAGVVKEHGWVSLF
jgi:hypothetical protein